MGPMRALEPNMALAYTESEDPVNLPLAKEICETLHWAYPNHSWWVRIDGGLIIIKHFAISGAIGMVKKFDDLAHDATYRKREVIMAAGELLERAGLARGANTGEDVESLDGGEELGWKPVAIKPGVIH